MHTVLLSRIAQLLVLDASVVGRASAEEPSLVTLLESIDLRWNNELGMISELDIDDEFKADMDKVNTLLSSIGLNWIRSLASLRIARSTARLLCVVCEACSEKQEEEESGDYKAIGDM